MCLYKHIHLCTCTRPFVNTQSLHELRHAFLLENNLLIGNTLKQQDLKINAFFNNCKYDFCLKHLFPFTTSN